MIEVVNLQKTYKGQTGLLAQNSVQALRGVSLKLQRGASMALIGESGCGKTTLGRIVTGVETYDAGDVIIDGVNLTHLPPKSRSEQFRKVQLIHQDPYSALNPARTIADALFDPLRLQAKRRNADKSWMKLRAQELLTLVGLDPQETLYKYPHQLSGGQRQRVVIARALTVDPEALIADEAVSMIDVSLRLGILNLLTKLRKELGIAVIFITHDVAAARYVTQDGQIAVIYKGEIVETGNTDELIQAPVHPYTQALLSAVPVMRGLEVPGVDRAIPKPEDSTFPPAEGGCLFASRCLFADQHCRENHPRLTNDSHASSRQVACFKPQVRHVVATAVEDAVSGV